MRFLATVALSFLALMSPALACQDWNAVREKIQANPQVRLGEVGGAAMQRLVDIYNASPPASDVTAEHVYIAIHPARPGALVLLVTGNCLVGNGTFPIEELMRALSQPEPPGQGS